MIYHTQCAAQSVLNYIRMGTTPRNQNQQVPKSVMGSRATVCLKSHSRKLDNSVRLQIGRPKKLVPLLTLNLHSLQLAKEIMKDVSAVRQRGSSLVLSQNSFLFTIGANLAGFESWWRRRGRGRCRRARRRGVRRGWRPSPTSPSCSSWNSTGSCERPTPLPPRLGMDLKKEDWSGIVKQGKRFERGMCYVTGHGGPLFGSFSYAMKCEQMSKTNSKK